MGRKIILKWISEKEKVNVCTEFMWFRTGWRCMVLVITATNLGFHKIYLGFV